MNSDQIEMAFHDEWVTLEVAQELKFDLTVPTEEDGFPKKRPRFERKYFAIACHTSMTNQQIMQHIQKEFGQLLQYVCISSPYAFKTSRPTLRYIQIIFHHTIIKACYFLKAIAGMECNYRVTSDYAMWHGFLQRSGHYIEFGTYPSTEARHNNTQRSPNQENIPITTCQDADLLTRNDEHSTKPIDHQILLQVKASLQNTINDTWLQINTIIEKGIHDAHQFIPVESLQQRTEVVDQLKAILAFANHALMP